MKERIPNPMYAALLEKYKDDPAALSRAVSWWTAKSLQERTELIRKYNAPVIREGLRSIDVLLIADKEEAL